MSEFFTGTFLFLDSTDFILQSPSGYYQSTPNAAKLLHYTTGNGCDSMDVCGTAKRICAMTEIGETYAQLQTAAGAAYPAPSGSACCGAPPANLCRQACRRGWTTKYRQTKTIKYKVQKRFTELLSEMSSATDRCTAPIQFAFNGGKTRVL